MIKSIRVLIAAFGTLAVAGSATAASYSTMYKNDCQLANGTLAWDQGRVANDNTTTTMTAQCPAPATSVMTIKSAEFLVWDRTSSGAVECTLNNTTSFNNDGTSTGWTVTGNSGVSFSGGMVSIAVDITDGAAGYVWTSCNIPPKSGANRSSIRGSKISY
jgi:hypothetical protein